MRKDVRTVLGLTLFLAAFTAACDNNPLKSDRDKGAFFFTNPSFATIVIGDSVKVTARVFNQFTAPTGDAVTATPCDSKITAIKDTSRTIFEAPERFQVYAQGLGNSCLVVAGGGLTDTIKFVVGPFSIRLTADTLLTSGATKPLTAVFRNPSGTPVSGLSNSAVTFVSRDTTKVYVNSNGTITGRAPGATYVVETLRPGFGEVTLKDSVLVTNSAGSFDGVISPTTLPRGGLVTLTAGSVPFDANTTVTLGGVAVTKISQTATTFQFVTPTTVVGTSAVLLITNLGPTEVATSNTVPVGPTATFTGTTPASITIGGITTITGGADPFDADTKVTVNGANPLVLSMTPTTLSFVAPVTTGTSAVVVLSNVGPNQLASTFTVPMNPEAGEPDGSTATARPAVIGGTYSGTVSATDAFDYYKLVLGASTAVTVDVLFSGVSADVDVIFRSSTGADTGRYACAGSSNPEHCTYTLPAGTYYIDVEYYAGTGSLPYRLTIN